MTTMSRRLPLIALAAVALGCSATLSPDEALTARRSAGATVGPAILSFFGDVTTVTLPQSARVREPVKVAATAFGGGCVSQAGTEASVSGPVAEVRPLRSENSDPDTFCTMELRIFEHTAVLRFSEPGEALVRVIGIARPGDTPFVVERRLTVLP
jgi:hypothetical protein